jgi:uncharacterized protein YecE (DUF72 family)
MEEKAPKTGVVEPTLTPARSLYYCNLMPKRPKVDLPTLFEMDTPASDLAPQQAERPYSDPLLLLGTSAFTASGWEGSFYPKGMKASQYLTHYGRTFRTVEIDSSFYGTPAVSSVTGWYEKTPSDFIFALKVPQVISHDKVLEDCDAQFLEFVDRISLLKEKLGPVLLQFPLFNQHEFKARADFLKLLVPFFRKLPETLSGRLAVEIRNKDWLDERFLDGLRQHNIALALTDTSWVPRPWELKSLDLITADFAYVRWLGHRKEIETVTTVWDKTVVDRTEDLRNWVHFIRQMISARKLRHVFLFANNHYAGHGPATIKLFWDLWNR